MSYDDRRKDFTKDHIYLVDLLMDYCSLEYGEAPCQAVLGETGQRKCFNTRRTCQDPDNYSPEVKRYRHVSPRSDLPANLQAIPDLSSVSLSPTELDIGGGLGRRASITASFLDAPSSDIEADKYVAERISGDADADGDSYLPQEVGTRWSKFKARNPYYSNRFMEVLSGYLVDGVFDESNFQKRTYVIEQIKGPNASGRVEVVGKDVLKLTNIDRAQAPKPSRGRLFVDIDDSTTTVGLTPEGIGEEYPSSGVVRIGSEVMTYTRSGDTLTVTRGQFRTTAEEHDAGSSVQLCLRYEGETVPDVLFDLLTVQADVPAEFIPKSEWDTEASESFNFLLNTIITEPTGVEDLLVEVAESAPHELWWDERTNLINFRAVRPVTSDQVLQLDDDRNIKADSVQLTDRTDKRISQVWMYYGQIDPTESLDDKSNYASLHVRGDLEQESQNFYRSSRIRTIYSRWITGATPDVAVKSASLIGRRFSDVPRMVEFDLNPKDSDLWTGGVAELRTRQIVDEAGFVVPRDFQILSVQERGDLFHYKGLESLFGRQVPDDDDPDDPVFSLSASADNRFDINIRDLFESRFGPVPTDGPITVAFTVPDGLIVGMQQAAFVGRAAINTGTWPSNVTLILNINGRSQGRAGFPGSAGNGAIFDISGDKTGLGAATNGGRGGNAIRCRYSCTINVSSTGEVWSGGGGGGGGGGAATYARAREAGLETIVANAASGGAPGGAQGELPGNGGNGAESVNELFPQEVASTGGAQAGTTEDVGSSVVRGTITTSGGLAEVISRGGAPGAPGEAGQPGGNGGQGSSEWTWVGDLEEQYDRQGSGGSGGDPGNAISADLFVSVTVNNDGSILGPTFGNVTIN